jgi:chromosome segregation ATPase
MTSAKLNQRILTTIFALSVPWVSTRGGQTQRSLTDREIESSETKTALQALLRDNAALEKKLRETEASVAALQKNLVVANTESEVFKRQAAELKLRLEALGLDAAGDPAKLEQKLLKAVNNLRIAEDGRKELLSALIELSEAVLAYQQMAKTTNADARQTLEAALRRAHQAMGVSSADAADAAAVPATLTDASVIAVKDELALIVANVGRLQGVREGMPFRVFRGNEDIGTVRVVDVREKIAGAVIQNLRSATVRVQMGDRLRVEAER